MKKLHWIAHRGKTRAGPAEDVDIVNSQLVRAFR